MVGISTYVPNRNHAKYLGRCLDSILTQSVKPQEVYVLDDHSEDNSCDVVRAKQEEYAKSGIPITLIRYEEKVKDWMLALHQHYHKAQGNLVHSMSADDFLLPGFYQDASRQMGLGSWDPGLIVADWFAVDVNGRSRGLATSRHPVNWGYRNGNPSLMEQLCKPRFFEGGPCALVRKDELLWLHSQEFHKLGSWNDSMGYSVVAWRKGAVYLTQPGGCFTLHDDGTGFNDQEKRDEEKAYAKFKTVWQFFHKPEVVQSCPLVLRTALANKVFSTLTKANQDRWDKEFQAFSYRARDIDASVDCKEIVRCHG